MTESQVLWDDNVVTVCDWPAYGWDDPDPGSVEEDVILSRLLALNLERAEEGL